VYATLYCAAGGLKDMRFLVPALVFAVTASAPAQAVLPGLPGPSLSLDSLTSLSDSLLPPGLTLPGNGAQELLSFKDSDIKFRLASLMEILRDHQHEGWVLAAYPDPNTRRPLIGAGFSLDVPETPHPQRDPFNPHPFVEPSAAQLWEAAGLPPERLTQILAQFDRDSSRWTTRQYRLKILRHTLPPQLTEEEAASLLRISAIQAVYNAKGYCRNFDELSGPQQMALSQLVFQMGTNLQEFVGFLGAVNDKDNARELPRLDGYLETEPEHWQTVQYTLIDSQWARRYRTRAATVIAMFDPDYNLAPNTAEQRVEAVLRPPVEDRPPTHRRSPATVRNASYSKHSAKAHGKRESHTQTKRSLT
jgi:hypothetical protein